MTIKADRAGKLAYRIFYKLKEDQPRLTKIDGSTYKKDDWFPFTAPIIWSGNNETFSEEAVRWFNILKDSKKVDSEKDFRIRPCWVYTSIDDDFDMDEECYHEAINENILRLHNIIEVNGYEHFQKIKETKE